jgi:PilZ domain-containing protein
MEKRPETRLPTEIPVRVWGMDADGKPFFQNATASNLSSEGALLSRLAHPLKAEEIVGIQYGEKKARFQIKWVKPVGVTKAFEAGVRILQGQIAPWQDLTAETRAASNLSPRGTESARPGDKRRYVRHRVNFPITISFRDNHRSHMQCTATDIGGRGCYVESLVPLQIGTEVIVTFWIDSEKISTKAMVRASDPGVGMGLEFTALEVSIQQKLQAYLDKIDQGFAAAAGGQGN